MARRAPWALNRDGLVKQVAEDTGHPRETVDEVLAGIIDTTVRTVATEGPVGITGFGIFERVEGSPRQGRNLKTGARVDIPETLKPKFRPGTAFKMYVAEPKTLPAKGHVGRRKSPGKTRGQQ